MRPVHIVYVTAGNGHRMAARAVREEFDRRGVPNVIMDLLDFSSDLFKWSYSDVYAFVSEHSHLACRMMYDLKDQSREESVMLRFLESVTMNQVTKFMRYIAENEPELILCTHFFPLNVLSRMKEQGLYNGRICAIITDYGLHRTWLNERVDRYFIASEWIRKELLEAGIPSGNITMSGIPVMHAYSERTGTPHTPSAEGRFRLLFVTSSIPNSLALAIVESLAWAGVETDLTIVTGRNGDLIRDLNRIEPPPNVRLASHGFVNNLDAFMRQSDLMITKPGGLTVSEALCTGIPMILVNPIPKQEINNSLYLQEKGAGILAKSADDVGVIFSRLSGDRDALAEMRRRALGLAYPNAAETLVDTILGEMVRTEGSRCGR